MTPIFFHPAQDVKHDFISVSKIPEFVRQSKRAIRSDFAPLNATELAQAHDPQFVDDVLLGHTDNGFGNRNPSLTRATRYTTANIVAATDWVIQEGKPVACSATQGFHHAHYSSCYGYCTFNGLILAAIRANGLTGAPVLVIDGDGHEGDGTNNIISRQGLQDDIFNVDRSQLAAGVRPTWDVRMWRPYFSHLIDVYKPGIILYQAGADAWDEDPYGAGYLSKEGLRHRDEGLFRAAADAEIPVVWNLAGGYADPMQLTIDIHLQTLRVSDEVYYG